MKLSIIIVNYNVSCFLEQALNAVYKALRQIEAEVFVVDNHSADNSLSMLAAKFPQVKVIANKDNVGFAKANNQAIRMATGEYILLLNPDTVVEEETFEKCIQFMDKTPDAGGLGVKMVNGKGEFLPESKRGIPLPSVAFYKLFGLSKLFPNSKRFGTYHLSFLSNDEIHSVEVLSGAFMLMRKSVLDKVGLLDEDYFMYGEDIDLSYRILKGGYKNYYFPKTRIIHYKGESTKTGSLNYVHVFYKAMQIFARKHFSQKNAATFNFLIDCAIWFRASLAALKRIANHLLIPVIDFVAVYVGMLVLAHYWSYAVLAQHHSSYPNFYYYLIIPLYVVVWLVAIALCKGYQKPIRLQKVNKGIVLGTMAILLVYALLPETQRFSRAVVLFGTMWTIIVVNSLRYIFRKLRVQGQAIEYSSSRRIAILGSSNEALRVLDLVQKMVPKHEFLGVILSDDSKIEDNTLFVGNYTQLHDLLSLYRINELVFCAKDIPANQIIDWMATLQDRQIEFRIAPENTSSVIGSNSIFSSEELYTISIHSIVQKSNRRNKRVLDVACAVLFLLFYVVDMWLVENKVGFLKNIFAVLCGKKSWVGCYNAENNQRARLKPNVLTTMDAFQDNHFTEEMISVADELYTRDYQLKLDGMTILKGFRQLGR